MGRTFNLNGTEYEIPTDQAISIVNHLVYAWELLGKPDDVYSEAGKKLIQVIFAAYEDCYPEDAYEWLEARKEHQLAELTIREQVSHSTGRSLASYPVFVYNVMKKFFKQDPAKREVAMYLAKEFPQFQMANKL